MSKEKIFIFDTTLRDGAQTEGVNFSIDDKNKKEFMFDAELFFDGYKNNPDYAMKCIKTAFGEGARWIVKKSCIQSISSRPTTFQIIYSKI